MNPPPTERQLKVLFALDRYGMLDRSRTEPICFAEVPLKSRPRVARRILKSCELRKWIRRHIPSVGGSPTPIFTNTSKGNDVLEIVTGDPAKLRKPTSIPQPQHILHYLAVVDSHRAFRKAAKANPFLTVDRWINEPDIVNATETDRSKHFQLFTEITAKPRLVCAPDGSFHITYDPPDMDVEKHGIFYIEQDRFTCSSEHFAKVKTKGYAEFYEEKLQRRHYPDSTTPSFLVLAITTTEKRRDRLAAVLKKARKPKIWRVAIAADLTPENAFHGPIWINPEKGTQGPLIKYSAPPDNPPAPARQLLETH